MGSCLQVTCTMYTKSVQLISVNKGAFKKNFKQIEWFFGPYCETGRQAGYETQKFFDS